MIESVQNSRQNVDMQTRVLTSLDPRTGEIAGNYAIMGADDVTRTLLEARSASSRQSTTVFSSLSSRRFASSNQVRTAAHRTVR